MSLQHCAGQSPEASSLLADGGSGAAPSAPHRTARKGASPRTEPARGTAQLPPQRYSPVQQEDLGGPPSKDELQGSLDVPSGGLQGPQAQLIVVYPHVSQLLQLGLPLALLAADRGSSGGM